MIGMITLSNGKKVKEIRRFDMSLYDRIIKIFRTAMDIAEDIKMNDESVNEEIMELEEELCVNTLQRIMFMDEMNIEFNIIKGKNDNKCTVSYSNEDAIKYLKLLRALSHVTK